MCSRLAASEIGGALDYSKCLPSSEVEHGMVASHLQYNPEKRSGERVVILLNLSWCKMSLFSAIAFDRVFGALRRMQELQVVQLEGCDDTEGGAGKKRLLDVVLAVLDLPHFVTKTPDWSKCGSVKLTIPSNRIDDAWVTSLLRGANQKQRTGVEVLVASDNHLTDKGVNFLSGLLPSLSELHIDGNHAVALNNAAEICKRLPSLTHMSADRTSISSTAMSHMLHCIETRAGYKEILPLTVCARALARDPEEGWVPMLDYCNTSEGKKHFVIKHDFKTGLGEANRCRVKCHDVVRVKLYVNRFGMLEVVHRNVMATRLVWSLAKSVIDELNVACLHTDKLKTKDTITLQLRRQYSDAVRPLLDAGIPSERGFALGGVKLEFLNALTKKSGVCGVEAGYVRFT